MKKAVRRRAGDPRATQAQTGSRALMVVDRKQAEIAKRFGLQRTQKIVNRVRASPINHWDKPTYKELIMKKLLLSLCLLFSASYAHAYGVRIVTPILIGPLAGPVYNEFFTMLGNSGATQCNEELHATCYVIHVSIVTGKRGRSRYIVGVATYVNYRTDTNELGHSITEVVKNTSTLKRSKTAWFTPEEWGITELP